MDDIDILGFQYDDVSRGGAAYGVSTRYRIHTAVFGLVGSGKSSILKLLILQNIRRNQGFMIIDPHGELARDILSVIPASRHDDVVYINPASLYRFGRVVRINPLEVENEDERYLVVMTFVNALYNLYKNSWGPRLETILRNAANALVETRYNSLGNLSGMITDQDTRRMILEEVSSKNVRHFWSDIYEKQYARDAGSAAYNKIDKILTTPAINAMFDTTKSSIRFADIIERNRMLIIDLSTGASDDVASFVGTILLNMLYVQAKKRLDLRSGDVVRSRPFFVYVDEAHLFSNSTMSEMLRALRKFGVRMTIATQTANAYARSFADEIPGICQCLVCGRCDRNTSALLSHAMSLNAHTLEHMPNHMFAFYSTEGGAPVTGVVRTRPVPAPSQKTIRWEDVARHSLKMWGEEVSTSRYLPRSGGARTAMTPLETALLCVVRGNPDVSKADAVSLVSHLGTKREAVSALIDVLEQDLRYVIRTDTGGYKVSRKAMQSYFSQAGWGRRAGGDAHLGVIFAIMNHQMRAGRYCVPDLGRESRDMADLTIREPASHITARGNRKIDGHNWSEKTAVALEVETAPSKHISQVVKNYTKNHDAGYRVWFVAFKVADADRIRDALSDVPRRSYHIDTVDAQGVISGDVKPPEAPFLLTSYKPLY